MIHLLVWGGSDSENWQFLPLASKVCVFGTMNIRTRATSCWRFFSFASGCICQARPVNGPPSILGVCQVAAGGSPKGGLVPSQKESGGSSARAQPWWVPSSLPTRTPGLTCPPRAAWQNKCLRTSFQTHLIHPFFTVCCTQRKSSEAVRKKNLYHLSTSI